MSVLKAGEIGRLGEVNSSAGGFFTLYDDGRVLRRVSFEDLKDEIARREEVKPYRAETSPFTFLATDYHVEQQTSSTTDTLPNTSTLEIGQIFVYSDVSGGGTTLQTSDSQTINTPSGGVTSIALLDGESLTVQVRPGGGWKLI